MLRGKLSLKEAIEQDPFLKQKLLRGYNQTINYNFYSLLLANKREGALLPVLRTIIPVILFMIQKEDGSLDLGYLLLQKDDIKLAKGAQDKALQTIIDGLQEKGHFIKLNKHTMTDTVYLLN